MLDRQPPQPPPGLRAASDTPSPEPSIERIHDAVFEDIEIPSVAVPSDAAPDDWDEASVPVEPPVVQVGDPFGDGAPSGDGAGAAPHETYRIGIEGDGAASTTALAPVPKPLPMPQPGGGGAMGPPAPPAPPVTPRAEARRAARDKLRMLRRYRWMILACTLLGFGAAALVSVLIGPTYTAHSVLLVSDRQGGADTSNLPTAPGEAGSRVLNQAIILQQAPEIAQQTAAAILARPGALTLSTVQAAAATYETTLTPEVYGEYLQEEVVSVSQAGEDVDAIRVEASAGDAEEAALIARLYTYHYQTLTRTTNRESVTETREILEEQIARRQGELDEIERQLEGYMTAENAAGLDAQTTATVSQIGQLQAQLDLARVEARTREAQLAELQQELADVPQRLDASAAAPSPVETTQLDADIQQIETLLEQAYAQNPQFRNNPNAHPDLQRLNTRLQSLRAERRRLAGAATDAAVAAGGLDLGSTGSNGQAYVAELQRQISQTRAALQGARAQASALAARLSDARGTLRAIPEQEMELTKLQRQQATTEATLAQLQREYDGTSIAESTELGFAQVVREVQVPRKPSSPNAPLNLALGTLLGLLAGLAIGFVRYQTDSRARTPDDLAEHGFTVVGTVPDLTDALRGIRQEVEGLSVHPGLVTVTHPFAPQAETFRHLHASLYAGADEAPQVVLVAGPDVGSGKSLVATNLAAAAAQAGRRVLLVDADLRRPTVAPLLGLGPQPPLGEGPEDTNLVYWSTAVPSLFALTPRDVAERPEQMWAPHQVGALVRYVRGAFDLVLIDTPSALASADAALLAPHADAALLIAEADQSDLDALTQVATELSGVGLTRIGAVLTRFDPRKTVGFQATAGVRHASRD